MRGILVGHTSGEAAYIVYFQGLKKTVTSSAITFDDIPRETPFMTGRPDHWTSPGPGIDDAAPVIEEEMAMEERDVDLAQTQQSHSIFDGRDIPRPPVQVNRESQGPIKAEENEDEQENRTGPGLRRGTRARVQFDPQHMPSGMREMEELTKLIEQDSDDEESHFAFCMLADTGITAEEALAGPEATKWKQAIESEDRGLEELKVITMEECPAGVKPLHTRYVLSKKRDPNGLEERYKARRVVQGFHQVYGRDFLETFAPVVGFDTLRALLKLVVNHGWRMRSMDFTQAYLNAPLKETIYVRNLDGSTGKLNKALYGLKQAGNEWNKTLREHISKRKCWKASNFDSCVFYALHEQKIAILAVYVDDLLITGSWEEEIKCIQDHLLNKFNGTIDLEPRTFLKLEIDRNGRDLHLHQSEYCKSIVEMVYQGPTRPAYVPLDRGADLTSRKEDEERLDLSKYPFRQVMGKLMYLSHMSRPDVSNSVRELGRQMHDPSMRHWRGLQHLLRYLATFPKKGIYFKCEEEQGYQLKGYSDADFAGDAETRRSCAGYVLFLGETPISWSSKTERSIVLSTTESEWTALARGIRHTSFMKGFLGEMGFGQARIPWFCDNTATIISAKTLGFNGRTRHVDVKLKFTRQEHELGNIELVYIPTEDQIADGLTKRLTRVKHEHFTSMMLRQLS